MFVGREHRFFYCNWCGFFEVTDVLLWQRWIRVEGLIGRNGSAKKVMVARM